MSLTKVTYSMIDGAASNVKDFGAVADGVTNDAQAIYNAIEAADNFLYIPDGTYYIDPSVLTVPNTTDEISQAQGDGAYSVFPGQFIPIVGKKGLYVKCGANVVFKIAENMSGFGAYRCFNFFWEGGEFLYADGVVSPSYAQEPFPILITRSFVSEIKGAQTERFHRGCTIYRCIASGVFGCTAIDANYFGFYVSSVADVTFDDLPLSGGRDRNYIRSCAASGGGTSNFFADHAIVDGCISRSPDISGGVSSQGASHFTSQFGFVTFENNTVYDNRNIESEYSGPGNIFSSGFNFGFSVSGTLGQIVRDVVIRNNSIRGCLIGVTIGNVTQGLVDGNDIRDYWLAGAAFYGGTTTENIYIKNNYFGGLNASSTASASYGDIHRAGLSLDGDSTTSGFSGFVVSSNIFDTDTIDAIFAVPSVDDLYIKDDNIVRSGQLQLTQFITSSNSIFSGGIKNMVKNVSGGTSGTPVQLTVNDSGKAIIGVDYVALPNIVSFDAYGQSVWFDFFPNGNGTMTIVGDSNIVYRISGSSSGQVVAGSTGITLNGNQSCRVYVGDAAYNLVYYNSV